MIGQRGCGGQQLLVIKGFLVISDSFMQPVFAVRLDGAVCDGQNLFSQDRNDFVVELKIRADEARAWSINSKTLASIWSELPTSILRETSPPRADT